VRQWNFFDHAYGIAFAQGDLRRRFLTSAIQCQYSSSIKSAERVGAVGMCEMMRYEFDWRNLVMETCTAKPVVDCGSNPVGMVLEQDFCGG